MRALIIVPLCLAAGCSGGEEANNSAETAAAARMEAGQWETTFEVTALRSTDGTTPVLKTKVGDKETGPTCLAASDADAPPPALFAGPGYTCTYTNSYVRGGRINASLTCTRKGLAGQVMMMVNGRFTATSFEGTVDANSYLAGTGDFALSRKMSGRKTAATCQSGSPEKAKQAQTPGP